jgi:beta-glucosidase
VARAKTFAARPDFGKEEIIVSLKFTLLISNGVRTISCMAWNGLCLQESPLSVRLAQYVSVLPAGVNAVLTWDATLIEVRGKAMHIEKAHGS